MGLSKGSIGIHVTREKKDDKYNLAQYEIVLAGNPNVGKSTVFNELTGLNQHTGNWTGKTVANAKGYYNYKGVNVRVVDLPGTYSLLSNSEEEEIARDYVCFGQYNFVVVVADATTLERNLNLFYQISEITSNVILCVNLMDEAEKNNIIIDKEKLRNLLGTRVIFTTARNKASIKELKDVLFEEFSNNTCNASEVNYGEYIEEKLKRIVQILDIEGVDTKKKRWMALRFIEGNSVIVKNIIDRYNIEDNKIIEIKNVINEILVKNSNQEIQDYIVDEIIHKSEEVANKVVNKQKTYTKRQRKIDKLLVSKYGGIPIMILMLLMILWITIVLANYPSDLLAKGFHKLEDIIRNSYLYSIAPYWLNGILIDGVYVTLTWVVSVMLPPMAIFFPLFTLIEDLGYLPRIAFNLDKCLKKCGACGKQALTMCMGLGCNAAGIIGCRIINSNRERLIAILTNVFMPCNGRFPTLIAISAIFIGGSFISGISSAIAVTFMIILGVLITLLVSKILSKTILKGMPSNFILELPPYRKPQVGKVLVRSLLDRTVYVLQRAVLIAIPAGAVIWIFANITVVDSSILTICADFLEPFGRAIGLDGYIVMAFILGLPANEIIVPIIIMSYLKSSVMLDIEDLATLKDLFVANGWTTLTAINMMLICLMHYPCGTTLWTIKKETKSFKWTALSFAIPTVLGIAVCFIITQIWNIIF